MTDRARPEPAEGEAPRRGRGGRRTTKLSEMVAREIVHEIASKRLPPNTMLPPESVMVEQYGVGRASLREALRVLEVQGLIAIKPGPGGGPVVAAVESRHFGKMTTLYLHLSEATFGAILQARMTLEPVMARLAADRMDRGHHVQLQRYIDDPQPGPHVPPNQQAPAASEFHAMVCGMSGNPVLDLFARAVRDIYVERQQGLTFPESDRDRVVREHVAIAEAIRDGEGDRAEELMHRHMAEFGEYAGARFPGIHDEVVDWH